MDWSAGDGQKVSEQALRLLKDLQKVAADKNKVRNRNLFFTMRLLFADSDAAEFAPKGFRTKAVSNFEIRGKSQAHSCGHIRTRFGSFVLKTEANVTVYTD